MGPWWLTWHLCLYICEKCEMSRLWRTDERTDGQWESSAVFSLSWIRNIFILTIDIISAWWHFYWLRAFMMFFVSFLRIQGLQYCTLSSTSVHVIEREHFCEIFEICEKRRLAALLLLGKEIIYWIQNIKWCLSSRKWFFSTSSTFESKNFLCYGRETICKKNLCHNQ